MKRFLIGLLFGFSTFLQANTTSIIVPCYPGHIKYLTELLDSLCSQTELPDEVVISISEFDKIDPEYFHSLETLHYPFSVRIFVTVEKLYAGQNRNAACSHANGDIFICQDADDLPHPQRIEMIKRAFKSSSIGLLIHRWVPSSKSDIVSKEYEFNKIPFYFIKNWDSHEVVDYIHYGNSSMRREVFDKVKWTDMKNGEDKRFLQDAMKCGYNLGLMDAFLLIYRMEYSSGN